MSIYKGVYSILSGRCIHHTLWKKLASPPNSVLYLDGSPAEEKKHTHKHRQEVRDKALTLAQKGVTQLKDRLDRKLHVRKQHFITVRKHMEKGFYWPLESRRAFAQYLRLKGRSVIECPTEADIAIAVRYRSGDIVISKDNDTPVYKSISTIWRPISRQRFLVYEIPDVLATLGISKTQLQFSTELYLVHEQVVLKNIKQETFDTSLKVFVLCVQTPVLEPLTLPSAHEASGEKTWRHKSLQRFNRYRTIDRPASQDKRTRCKQHELPQNMVQYAWKPWEVPESPLVLNADVSRKKMEEKNREGKKTTPKPVNASAGKGDLVRAMAWEHPMVTLDVGTVPVES
ncbi:hypothetical protein EDD21DRAFT_410345 [Dissophora ornata]|nr:hypothetical protein EDD21DRAFT_410345 [Dissophora ornata]